MIRLSVLGSGSSGNAFILESPDGMLLLDAGFSAKELTRRAGLLDLDLSRLTAVVLTHEHGDHASGARLLATRYGVPIAATDGTRTGVRGMVVRDRVRPQPRKIPAVRAPPHPRRGLIVRVE